MMRSFDVAMIVVCAAALLNTYVAGVIASRLHGEVRHLKRVTQLSEQLRLIHEKRAELYRALLVASQAPDSDTRIDTFGGAR